MSLECIIGLCYLILILVSYPSRESRLLYGNSHCGSIQVVVCIFNNNTSALGCRHRTNPNLVYLENSPFVNTWVITNLSAWMSGINF